MTLTRCPVHLVLLILLAGGCGGGVPWEKSDSDTSSASDCEIASAHVVACGLTVDQTGFGGILRDDACSNACVATCIANASCSELESDQEDTDTGIEHYGCSSESAVLRCIARECDGGCSSEDSGCPSCNTPLVLSFDDHPVCFVSSSSRFDFGDGPVQTDWPSADTPWLARDRNGDGRIDDARELFGDATPMTAGARARNGFQALADLDTNRDGLISPADPAWGSLLVWTDRDGDHASSPEELVPLSARGVAWIGLTNTRRTVCDARDNCEGERGQFGFGANGVGAVIDVYLPEQEVDRPAGVQPVSELHH